MTARTTQDNDQITEEFATDVRTKSLLLTRYVVVGSGRTPTDLSAVVHDR